MKRRAAPVLLVLLAAPPAPAAAQGVPPRAIAFVEAVKGTEAAELRWPVAVAAASESEFGVADAFGPRLLRFRKVGVSWRLDGAVSLPGTPVGLAWDGKRYVASLRQVGGLVAFEGPELAQRRLPLPRGAVPGALFAFANGDLLVHDLRGEKALRLADGRVASEVAVGAEVTALAATPAGGCLAAIARRGAVLLFDANGRLADTWKLPASNGQAAWPAGLAVEPGGDVVVTDRASGRLLVLDASGRLVGFGSRPGWEPGLLLRPAGLARLPDGLFVVADQGNGRAQVFRRSR